MNKSIQFYGRYCRTRVVHERENDGVRVAWLGWGEDPPKFVFVLIERGYDENRQPPLQHIGMSVDSRDEVDAAHARAQSDGISGTWPPTEGGAIVGYYCGVPDPDGNLVEFSFGQRLG